MKHIFICGAKSIGRYGGYETFVNELAKHMEDTKGIQLHILCKSNGEGATDESVLENVTRLTPTEFMYHGAHCIKIKVPNLGAATAIWYDAAAVNYSICYCREHGIDEPVLYILTCRIGLFINGCKRQLQKIQGQLHLNPDGHEWKRKKWPLPVRLYWKWSEKRMVRAADLVICDSLNIEKYIQNTYRNSHVKTTYISYGGDAPKEMEQGATASFRRFLERHGLQEEDYYLVVCRFVPENNIRIILREFMQSKTKRRLALVMTEDSKYQHRLEKELHFSRDERICFLGEIYDQKLLTGLRKGAWAYLHGHEVGGTNPSLLESLEMTKVNLVLQVPFNEEVARDAARYWTKEPGNLAALLDETDLFSEGERSILGEKARGRIRDNYSWQHIADEYKALWRPE